MNTRQSSYDLKVDSAPFRVTPVTSYDPFEAKFCASLYWLVFRATEDGGLDDIPPQVTSPLERDAEHRITVRPEVIELLTSADIYGKVCDSTFNNKEPVVDHWAVIQCLSRHGFYVVEEGDIAVTDSTLQQERPFRKSTHLALMDALMSAYSTKVVTIPQVVQAVRRFAAFNASKELPFDLEDALLLWLNKVSASLNDKEINKQKQHAEHLLRDQDKAKRFRFRRDQLQPKAQTLFPFIDDLLKGISDGQCLLGVVMFYHGDGVKLEDIKFGQDLSQEDMVHNIELFRSLCSQYITTTSLSLQVEDFMYSSHAMKPNIIALLAEMFYKCELEDDTIIDEKKLRSHSAVNMTDPSDITMKDGLTTNNFANNRSSSAPMLASEIIATLSPSVGRKLKDFAKEKSQQRSASNPDQLARNLQNKENTTPRNYENEVLPDRFKNSQSYSLQLDFTDEKDLISSNGQETEPDTGNPFSGIFRKPMLATRKHSAPERVGEPSPRIMPRVEPKLNRRTKQKTRTLALEDWEMEEKDVDDIQVTDLQRSQSLTGLDSKNLEPRQSFHAWQDETSSSDPNLDINTMKSQRISLDYRPNKSQARDIQPKSSLQSTDKYREERVSDDSLLSCSPKSADSLSNKPSPALKRKEIPVVSQSIISEQELTEFEEMEAIVLAQRSNESNKNTELSDDDVLNASVSSDDMNRFRLEVLQRLTADKIKTLEKQINEESNNAAEREHSDARLENQTEREEAGAIPLEEREEELLSPINESSEPLHTSGSLPDTRSSTPSTTPSSPCSPLDVAPFTPEFFMTSPANTLDKKAYKKAAKARKDAPKESRDRLEANPSETPRFENLVQNKDRLTPRHKSVDILARGSYCVDQISMDAAKAAGIPVIGSESVELRNMSSQSRLARTTVRSLSVPEPLDNDRTPNQVPSLHDRVSGSNPYLAGQSLYSDRSPRPGHGGHNLNSHFGSHVVSQEELLQDAAVATRHFSPQPPDDVVIYDRRTADTHYDVNAHARDRTTRGHHVDSNTVLAPSYPGFHESARQSFVDRGLVHDSRNGAVYAHYGGMVPDEHTSIRHDYHPEQFAAAVSERLVNHSQRNDHIDASHVRTSQGQEYLRDSYVRNSFIPTSTDNVRGSIIDTRNSFINQDVRNSFVGNQETDSRFVVTSNIVMETTPTPYSYGSVESVSSQEPRTVYSDQYGTYVKSSKSHNIPHGQYHVNAPPMYNQEMLQQGYSSPRQVQERQSSPGQFATFRKSPGPPVINRQPAPEYQFEQQVSTNQITTSQSNYQVTAGIPLVHQANWNYPQAPSNIEGPTSQQYSSAAHVQGDPSFQSSSYYPRPSMQTFQTSPPRHSSPGTPSYVGDNRYQMQPQQGYDRDGSTIQMREDPHPTFQSYNQQLPQEAQRSRTSSIDSVSRDRVDPRNQAHPTLQSYNHQLPQEAQRSRTSSIDSVSRDREDPRNQAHPTLQSYRTEMTSNRSTPQEAQRSRSSSIDSRDDGIDITPERKSQAFTVDLDTGEIKEFNSSSDNISPRSPASTILRSRTFRKGPEEKVFDYEAKSLPGQHNDSDCQETGIPQPSNNEPEVVLRKKKNHSSLVNRTSWSESAEALKAVLYNGFPTLDKDDEVVPSPRRHTVSPRTTERTSPGARITWMTAGRNSFGGQVLLNEKGEIEESITNDVGDDTATPQHLTLLRLQFEEKRRQIEAEKRRSQEQWEEERRRLGETAFWYTIGRAQGGDKDSTIGRAQGGDKDAVNVRPGHERVPNHEPLSPGQPTPPIGRSTPLESMSPLQIKTSYQIPTVEGYQSPRGDSVHTQPTIGHGYHQAPFHRPGHQSPSQSGYQSPAQSGYQSPAQSDYQSPVTSGGFQFPSQPASTNFQHDHHNNVHEQEYETHEFRLSDNPPQLHTQQNTPPSQPSPNQNGPMKSPSRKCWDVNPAAPPSPTTAFTPTSPEGEALHVEDVQEEQGGGDNQYDDAADVQNKKGFSMFIGDESEKPKPKEGLTPEQQKKRERFLRSRQKKQEEEKTRRDAENEKKKLREVKHKEVEEQKRHEVEQREEQQRRMKLSRERLAPSNGGESTYRPWPGTNQQDDHSSFAEFSGPRCYVKPSGKSNRKLITNAISHVCLSGTVNKENKEKCLQALADSSGIHFIVLFKDGLKFRGLYMLNPETEQGFKVFGIGPKVISSKMVDCVYKYSSGGKEFVKIPSKSLSISVDGVAIQKTYWQPNKPNVASKTQSNLKRPPRPPQR